MKALPILLLLLTALAAPITAQMDYQPPPDLDPLNRAYDKFLDAHARDGIFSYREIRLDRATLDRYDRALAMVTASDSVNLRLAPVPETPEATHARYRGRPGAGIARTNQLVADQEPGALGRRGAPR